MTRYFFDVLTDGKIMPEEGMILPNMDAARTEATCAIADLARDTLRSGGFPREGVEVRTSDGPAFEAALLWNYGRVVEPPQTRILIALECRLLARLRHGDGPDNVRFPGEDRKWSVDDQTNAIDP
ncbi:DUF6894 family protein [Bradyrhizobium sp. sBnM-33]|uniref:DUF6894 family protein n=1 Tax=Bradyrhizobium sp. sBnM-33 TaxID=2831780 RepID=UPI001BCDA5AD|nr:hypothetical protein [Bradyrhizobium sp. sBnM-33]WOH53638.1 hypothetical protein RX328_17055 [Bradyrhizobium sp. sBnM-33]